MLPRFGPVGQPINPEDTQFAVNEGVTVIDVWSPIALGTVDGVSSSHPIAGAGNESFAIYVGAQPSLVQWNLALEAAFDAEEQDYYDVRLVNYVADSTTIRRTIAEFRLPFWANSESGSVRDYFRLVDLPPSQPGFTIAQIGLQVLCGDASTIKAYSSFQRLR